MSPRSGSRVWLDEDPSDRLVGAWEGATVEGPFVLESRPMPDRSEHCRADGYCVRPQGHEGQHAMNRGAAPDVAASVLEH